MNAYKLDIDGTLTEVDLGASSDEHLTAFYAAIGCHLVDVVRVRDDVDFWIDDEGLFTQEPNWPATWLCGQLAQRGMRESLHGPVVITGGADDEGDTVALSAGTQTEVNVWASLIPAELREAGARLLAESAESEAGDEDPRLRHSDEPPVNDVTASGAGTI